MSDISPVVSNTRKRGKTPLYAIGFFLGAGLLIFLVLYASTLYNRGRSFLARRKAEEAITLINKKEFNQAHQALMAAQSWRNEHPLVLRGMFELMRGMGAPPESVLATLRNLHLAGHATQEDYLSMGEIYIQLEDLKDAQLIMQRLRGLDPDILSKRRGMELAANILRLEGNQEPAEALMRKALMMEPQNPHCRLRLALMDVEAPFMEIRTRGRDILWEVSAGKDKNALMAIDWLCRDQELKSTQAETLLERIRKHPDTSYQGQLYVLAAYIRLRPDQRQQRIDAEIQRQAKASEENLSTLASWLNAQEEHARVLKLRPREIMIKSPRLLQNYLQALGISKRWDLVEQILTTSPGLPLSNTHVAFWRANAMSKIDPDLTRARGQLRIVYEGSQRGRDAPMAKAAAALCEEVGIWDMGIQFYEGLAEHQPQSQIPMLEKAFEMAHRARETNTLLDLAKRLQKLRPENFQYQTQLLYLRLVAGDQIESVAARLQDSSTFTTRENEAAFIRALCAYRMGDIDTMRSHLRNLISTDQLEPGQRAVHAGLLSASGKLGQAFQIAEKISTSILLPEETYFLRRAL
jgi:tetratricopeptide (TPR) repeat protein